MPTNTLKQRLSLSKDTKVCDEDSHSSYLLREQKLKEHGTRIGSGNQHVDVTHPLRDIDDISLKEESETRNDLLVVSEIEKGRHRMCNFTMDTLHPKYLLANLAVVFDGL